MMTWTRNRLGGAWKEEGLRIVQYLFLTALALANAMAQTAQQMI